MPTRAASLAALRTLRRRHNRQRSAGVRHADGPIIVRRNGPSRWPGSWAVAVECLCNASHDTELESVHYIFGPYATAEAADSAAETMTWALAVHVFPLWPDSKGTEQAR